MIHRFGMTIAEVRRTYDIVAARWHHGTSRAQALLDIDTLEALLGRLEDLPATAEVTTLWRRVNYLQGEMRLQAHREVHRNGMSHAAR
jgi:hypothetical protein